MRSLSHELVHHVQNCRGEFDDDKEMGEGYAQNDKHLREMEREAYEVGNMCFRDWEDSIKQTIYFEHLQKGEKKMSIKDWKNNEISTLLSEAWGFKFNTLEEFDAFNGNGEIQTEAEEELDELAGASQSRDRRKPHQSAKYKDEKPKDDEDNMEEGEDREDDDDAGESLEEGFMDTMRKAGRSLGRGNFGRAAKELSAQLVAIEKGLADGSMPSSMYLPMYDVVDAARTMSPELEPIAQKIDDYASQNFRRDSGPEVKQNLAQMIAQLKAKVADYAAGKKLEENDQQIFAPNHYCVHHGGVEHNGAVQMAEAVGHNWNKKLGKVTAYDMKLKDGTILENVAVEDIQVTNASLAEGHGDHPAKRDDDEDSKKVHKKGDKKHMNEDDIEEVAAKRAGNEDRDVGRDRMHADRMHEKQDALREAIRSVLAKHLKG